MKTAADRFVVTPNNLTIDAYAILDTAPGAGGDPRAQTRPGALVHRADRDAFDDVICNLGGTHPALPGSYLITGPTITGGSPAA